MDYRLEIDPILRKYCEDHSSQESEVLVEIEKFTHLNTVKRLDVSDKIQGRLLSFISHLVHPSLIVEIGTFTAYATGCLAEGLAPGGRILSIENDSKFESLIRENLRLLNLEQTVELLMSDALEVLPNIAEPIDLVFIDAAKYEYEAYFNIVIDKMKSGGIILADNILWKGRVLHFEKDKMTQAIHDFNHMLASDKRVQVVILPYRDGLSLIRKI